MKNSLVEKYGASPRWVAWRLVMKDKKLTKVPYQTNGKLASSTDPSTHTLYANIKGDKKGIVLLEDKKLICIDIDHCIEDGKIVHEQKEIIADFILESDSYTEISQSGKGLHIFLEITEPLTLLKNRHEPFEVYVSGRYIAVTENCYGKPKEVRTVTPDESQRLIKIIGYPWGYVAPQPTTNLQQPTTNFDDETILIKMFKSTLGAKIKALYENDISEYNNNASVADAAFCRILAFWTGKNAEQMERIWLAAPIGQRDKMKRKDYRKLTIDYAVSHCTKVYETPAMKIVRENPDLDLLFTINKDKEKILTQNTENMCRILRGHANFQGRFHYDEFKNTLEIFENNKWRNIEDNDSVNIQTQISILFPIFGKVGKDMVYDAIIKVAKENRIDSAADYITSLRWDGTARLDTWLCKAYGALNGRYAATVGANWVKGLVKRIIQPGCKFDYVLVLEGPQGSKKSTSLAVLGGSWHIETSMSTESKDFFMQFQGKAIIEFSEGETLSRTEVKRMKAIITTPTDKFRPPYERNSQEFPRRCVFAMTTNEEEYLKDDTGNRRWLPVRLVFKEANIEWLQANRDQLFAEAYHRVINLKETIYEFPEEEMLAAQEERRTHDENEEIISEWYLNVLDADKRAAGVTTHQVFTGALSGETYGMGRIDRLTEMKIAGVLKSVLKLTQRRPMIRGTRYRLWFDETGRVIDETQATPNQVAIRHFDNKM